MALQLPRGLFNVGIRVLADGVPGSLIAGFRPQQINPAYQSNEFNIQGGDVRLEQGHDDERYEFTLTTAGWPLAGLAAMAGSTVVTTGADETAESVIAINATDPQPRFQLVAQQRDATGGDTSYLFPECQENGKPGWTANQGEYATPEIPIVAYAATTAVAGSAGPPEVQAVAVGDLVILRQRATFAALA